MKRSIFLIVTILLCIIFVGNSSENYKVSMKYKSANSSSITSCNQIKRSGECLNNSKFACLWVKKKINYNGKSNDWQYCNFDDLTYISCGTVRDLPSELPILTSTIVNLIKVVTPIILIIISIVSLIKAVASSNEEEMNKVKKSSIKRIIAAAMVFFVIQLTQFVIFKVSDIADEKDLEACFSCFLNNDCQKNIYYKSYDRLSSGRDVKNYYCTYASGTIEDCY